MSNAMVPYSDMEKMAKDLVDSRFFGVKSIEECMALMLIAQAEGLHPAVAVRDYHVIQGKPSLKADAMLARFQQQGGVVEWIEVTDKRVAAKFSHSRSSPTPTLIEWDDARVIQAQLGGNAMHKKYPRQMKRARVISEGVRTVYPACTNGLCVPEEIADILPQSSGASAAVIDEPPPVVKPTMREIETQRVIDPPTEPEAKAKDDRINGSPLEANEPTGRYKCPPDLDGTDLAGIVLTLYNGDPHREVIVGLKGGRKKLVAGSLVEHMVSDFFSLLKFRWEANEKPKSGAAEENRKRYYDRNRTEIIDDLAAVLEAQAEREKLEAEADADDGEYATKLPKA